MNELTYTVAQIFKRRGVKDLKENDFIFGLSMDLKWLPPDLARKALKKAEEEGLVKREGDILKPVFDVYAVEVPFGFQPDKTIFEEKTVFDKIVERIVTGTGKDKREVIAQINKKQEKLFKLFEIEVSALLVAKECDIPIEDLAEEAYKQLISSRNS